MIRLVKLISMNKTNIEADSMGQFLMKSSKIYSEVFCINDLFNQRIELIDNKSGIVIYLKVASITQRGCIEFHSLLCIVICHWKYR